MWWQEFGSQARDDAGLSAERNVVRYCRPRKSIAIRIDDASSEQLWYLRGLIELAGLDVEFSAESLVRGLLDVTLESVQELVNRSASFSKVRWLSGEVAPTLALLESGVSVDTRALAQSGSVELPRWLLEQSVAITNHRYGNVHAGPKPLCRGLGERETR
jgi:RHH-type proline utilization regulon transcriptional repressor/proline dehydrogenase/delta 1-pyrroline-5-carboxylate dehydrogenase